MHACRGVTHTETHRPHGPRARGREEEEAYLSTVAFQRRQVDRTDVRTCSTDEAYEVKIKYLRHAPAWAFTSRVGRPPPRKMCCSTGSGMSDSSVALPHPPDRSVVATCSSREAGRGSDLVAQAVRFVRLAACR